MSSFFRGKVFVLFLYRFGVTAFVLLFGTFEGTMMFSIVVSFLPWMKK